MTFEEMKNLPEEEQEKLFKRLSEVRGNAKLCNFSSIYGVGDHSLSASLGVPREEARSMIDAFWVRNWSVEMVAKNTTTQVVNKQMWLLNPVANMWYSVRTKKDIFSTLNQGTGAFCFDMWLGFLLKDGAKISGQFHDELLLYCKEGREEDVREILDVNMNKVNGALKLNVELTVDTKFGKTYADVH